MRLILNFKLMILLVLTAVVIDHIMVHTVFFPQLNIVVNHIFSHYSAGVIVKYSLTRIII